MNNEYWVILALPLLVVHLQTSRIFSLFREYLKRHIYRWLFVLA